jgi:6,7-dimethyl-8-ribityllumazine synthase
VAGSGSPDIAVENAEDLRVAVVAARWHAEITAALLDGALRALRVAGIEEPTVLRVPGTFELPVAAGALAERGYDAVVALGVVVRGGTPHFDYVCQAAAVGLTEVSVRHGVPVGFGVLTCDTEDQARDRSGLPGSTEDKGYDAAVAAIATALSLRDLRPERIS